MFSLQGLFRTFHSDQGGIMQDLGQDARLQLKGNRQQPTVCIPKSPAHACTSRIVLWHAGIADHAERIFRGCHGLHMSD